MDDLIKALQILRKHGNPAYPTMCEHDVMVIADIDPKDFSEEEIAELQHLGFFVGDEFGMGHDSFVSYKFGSA